MTGNAQRDPAVAALLAATEAAVLADAAAGSDALRAAREVFARCRATTGATGGRPARLPVCDRIAAAAAVPRTPVREAVARAFLLLADRLAWGPSRSAEGAEAAFREGHANATILGPGGLEDRPDVMVGVSLMAPHLSYPVHRHPPEEVYLALTPGEWWNAGMDWTDPGPRGFIYNPPGIAHAMRSGETPFLALWLLPV